VGYDVNVLPGVLVEDIFGRPVQGATVNWSVTLGGWIGLIAFERHG
jgi:hypothetical protein